MDRRDVLARFDSQLRQDFTPPRPGWVVEKVGRVKRCTPPDDAQWGNYVEWSDLDESNALEEITAQIEHFGARGRKFEWKHYGYDKPANLPELLVGAGFVPEEQESVLVGDVVTVLDLLTDVDVPEGVTVRHVRHDDWDGLLALQRDVWGHDAREMVDELRAEVEKVPETIRVHVAVAGDSVVSAGWVRFHEGSDFASLWGGSTHPDWRGRGIYRRLVRRRAEEAADRGFPLLQVDASEESRPILERLGMEVLTTTTPYVWTPPGG